MASNRRFFRGAAPGILRSLVAYGAVTSGSTLQTRNSLYNTMAGSPLIRAFIQTTQVRYRMTEQAFFLMCEIYAKAKLREQGMSSSENARLSTIGLYTMGWLHEGLQEEELPAAEYANLNALLGTLPPDPVFYRRIMSRWLEDVKAMQIPVQGANPRRATYHRLQLHYILPEYVAAEHRASIEDNCNLAAPADMADFADVDGVEMVDADWAAAWRQLTLQQKVRFLELAAVLEFGPVTRRANAAIFVALISLVKMGTMSDEWLENQLNRFKGINNEVLDTTVVSVTTASALYKQFAVRANLDSFKLYDHLMARYVEFTGLNLEALNWIIEQASLTGAASVSLIADSITTYELRWEILVALGFPVLELQEWVKAVLLLSQNRLCALVASPINSATYANVLEACRSLMSGATFAGYQGGSGRNLRSAESLGKQLAAMVKAQTQARNDERINPANLVRTAYGMDIYEDAAGNLVAVPVGEVPDNPELVPHRGTRNTPAQVLASIGRSAKDDALRLLASHALMIGRQERWDITAFTEGRSPIRAIPAEIREAAAALGVAQMPVAPVYHAPVIPAREMIYPPWDLGCRLRDPVARPGIDRPRRGPDDDDSSDDDDDDDQFRPDFADDALSANAVVRVLSGEAAIGEVLRQPDQVFQPRQVHPNITRPVDDQVPGTSGTQQQKAPPKTTPVLTEAEEAEVSDILAPLENRTVNTRSTRSATPIPSDTTRPGEKTPSRDAATDPPQTPRKP